MDVKASTHKKLVKFMEFLESQALLELTNKKDKVAKIIRSSPDIRNHEVYEAAG